MAQFENWPSTTAMWWWRWVPIEPYGHGYGYWEHRCLNG